MNISIVVSWLVDCYLLRAFLGVREGFPVLVQVAACLEREIACVTWIRPLSGVFAQVFLQNARLSTSRTKVFAYVFPRFLGMLPAASTIG